MSITRTTPKSSCPTPIGTLTSRSRTCIGTSATSTIATNTCEAATYPPLQQSFQYGNRIVTGEERFKPADQVIGGVMATVRLQLRRETTGNAGVSHPCGVKQLAAVGA